MTELRLRESKLRLPGTADGQNRLEPQTGASIVARQAISLLLIFLLFLSAAVLIQLLGGAYTADLSGSDESAHYVTGLMVRSFLLSADWLRPMQFAQEYYDVYPRVAIGHWPPGFYFLQAFWTLLFSPSRESILLLMAVLAATCSLLTFLFWRPAIGPIPAAAAGIVFLCLPVVQQSTQAVMAELLIAAFSILAIWAYSIYLQSGRARDSLLFGFVASLAILTKLNFIALACVPPAAVLLIRKPGLVRRFSFWLPAGLVLITCAPWHFMTLDMARQGWQGSTNPRFLLKTVASNNFEVFYAQLGSAIALLTVIGIFGAVVSPIWKRQAVQPVWAVSFAALAGIFLFQTFVVPLREPRHFVFAFPMALAFAANGALMLAQRIQLPYIGAPLHWRAALLGAGALVTFGVQSFALVQKPSYGAIAVAELLASNQYANAPILVSSPDSRGEGAIIAELAMRSPAAQRRVFRASKILGQSNWGGDGYKLLVEDHEQIRKVISDLGIDIVVWQAPIFESTEPHHYELAKVLHGGREGFKRISIEEKENSFEVYEIDAPARR